jgi:phospholipid/cholesterol/gamma-HCH transport system substrate-binding protein
MPRTRSIAWSQLKLGIIGIAAAAMVVVIVIAVGGQGGFFWQRYPIKAQFLDAQGLKTGAVVRLSGKDVGRVTSVEFAGSGIEVAFEVSKQVRPLITDKSHGKIGSVSLLGEAILDITASRTGTPVPDWGYVPTQEGGVLADLTTSASDSLRQAGELIADARKGRGTIGKLVTDDTLYKELEQFVASASDVANKLKAGKGTAGQLLNDPAVWTSLKASLENLQAATSKINTGQGALGRFLNDEAMGKSLAATLANLDEVTAGLRRGEGTAGKLMTDRELYDRLNGMTAKVDGLAASLNATVTSLNTGQGTAGQLLHDQRLYENMNQAVVELRDLLAAIKKDPKKYLTMRFSIF